MFRPSLLKLNQVVCKSSSSLVGRSVVTSGTGRVLQRQLGLLIGKVKPGSNAVRVSPQILPKLHQPDDRTNQCLKVGAKQVEDAGLGHDHSEAEDGDVEGPLVPLNMVSGYEQLLSFTASHPFWNNLIFRNRKTLTRDEYKFFFEQYYHYSRNFTRYLSGLMFRCDDDLLRSRLTQNLWEEGGGAEVSKRHSQIFRDFLVKALKVDLKSIQNEPCTIQYVNQYLDGSANLDALYSAAFLSLGTEGIVSPMYARLVDGMVSPVANFDTKELLFFHIHIGCDDDHAGTLAEIMFKYAAEYQEKHPNDSDGWIQICQRATDDALNLRKTFFDHLYQEILDRRASNSATKVYATTASTLNRANQTINGGRQAIQSANYSTSSFASVESKRYFSTRTRLSAKQPENFSFGDVSKNIEGAQIRPAAMQPAFHLGVIKNAPAQAFSASRKHPVYPVNLPSSSISIVVSELDAGKTTSRHRHAYEALIYILEGSGRFEIEGAYHELTAGDAVFIPPWHWHSHTTTSNSVMRYIQSSNLPLLSHMKISPIRQEEVDAPDVNHPKRN